MRKEASALFGLVMLLFFFVVDGKLFLKLNSHRLECEMVEAIYQFILNIF
jgi:hypothetical protein